MATYEAGKTMKTMQLRIISILLLAIIVLMPRQGLGAGAEQEAKQSTEPAVAALGTTVLVSVASDGTQGNYGSSAPSVSTNGRYIAFHSPANNLVSGDGGQFDIFIHDSVTGETSIVSLGFDGSPANHHSEYPSISSDGKYVAYHSYASNLISNDINGPNLDIFVYERQTGQTSIVSIATDGTQGNSDSRFPSISGDGRYVSFYSLSTNLVNQDTNRKRDVFVHDRQEHKTIRASVASDGTQGNYDSEYSSISSDGHFVAFESIARNLVAGDTNARSDIFVHDIMSRQTERVSIATDGTQGNGDSKTPSISDDGRYVVFTSLADNLVLGDDNGFSDVFVHDRLTDQTTLISVSNDGTQGNDSSVTTYAKSISEDGCFIVFQSTASNLVEGDTNNENDVFVHDRQTGSTTRVSIASDGTQGNDFSFQGSISTNGQYLVFTSAAENLVNNDSNGVADVFMHWGGVILDLPISYTDFATTLQGVNNGGRVTSWFDHQIPAPLEQDAHLLPWTGYPAKQNAQVNTCTPGNTCYDNHEGIDFSRKTDNESIYAAAPGKVYKVISDCEEGKIKCGYYYGNQVRIDHGNGYATLYGHLNQVFVKEGDTLTPSNFRTSPIGTMGKTGNVQGSNGTHLHFSVFYDPNKTWTRNRVIDPYGWWDTQKQDPWINNAGMSSPYLSCLWKKCLAEKKTITNAGSTITSTTNKIFVNFPAGAVSVDTILELLDTPPVAEASAQLLHAGTSFWLRILEPFLIDTDSSLSTLTDDFAQPVTIQVSYQDEETTHINIDQLAIYQWSETNLMWEKLASTVDTTQNTVTANTTKAGKFNLQGPLLCSQDNSEPNDNANQAWFLSNNVEQTTSLFDIQNDEDWYWINAKARIIYIIEAINLSANVDPKAELYDFGGDEILLSDDNGGTGKGFKLKWTASRDGTYFLRVSQAPGSAYGCSANYDLKIVGIELLNSPTGIVTNPP